MPPNVTPVAPVKFVPVITTEVEYPQPEAGAKLETVGGWEIGGIINARSGLPMEIGIVRPDVVMQCAAATCPVTINGVATTVPQGFVANLPSGALPLGFVGVINTPGGGASRNIRRPNLIPGVSPYLNNDRNLLNPAANAKGTVSPSAIPITMSRTVSDCVKCCSW